VNRVYELGKKAGIVTGGFFSSIYLAGYFALLTVLAYGGTLVINGEMTVGSLTSFILYR
jgi:putative ABC transport system ATP-binding protein